MTLIATLIANPQSRNLGDTLATAAKELLGSKSLNWLDKNIACDIELAPNMPQQQAEEVLAAFLAHQKVDFAIQPAEGRRKKALIADMDSTMIDQECIDELAAEVGLKEKVAAITAKAMNGEIEFEPAVIERVALLEGLDAKIVQTIIEKRITLAQGGKTLVKTMKANGAYTALVSGGFTSFTSEIARMIGFDENRANRLEEQDGKLTGRVILPILGADAKVEALEDIARVRNISAEDFIAVGDGANDLPMLMKAGTGVALHSKPSVATRARIRIDHGDLTALLYLQGYSCEEFLT